MKSTRELKDQIAGETGEVWAWVQRQPTVQGRNHQALLIDEFTRQLTQALPDTVEWVDVRSKMSNDLTLSGNVWSLCHAFGAGILPLVHLGQEICKSSLCSYVPSRILSDVHCF